MVAAREYGQINALSHLSPVADCRLLVCRCALILERVRSSLLARMTDEVASSYLKTRKKSYFQITKVVAATAEDDGDDDGDEDEVDGEEDEYSEINEQDVECAPVNDAAVHQSNGGPEGRSAGAPALQSTSTSCLNGQSSSTTPKFRLVRITKKTTNKQFSRGRWHCWDFSEPENAQQSPNDQEQDTADVKHNGNETRGAQAIPESSLQIAASRSKLERVDDSSSSNGSDRNGCTADNGRQHKSAHGRPVSTVEEQSGRDRLNQVLNDVRSLILDFSKGEQRDKDSLYEKNVILTARMTLLQARERQLVTELDDLRLDFQRVQEENRRLVHLLSAVTDQRPQRTDDSQPSS